MKRLRCQLTSRRPAAVLSVSRLLARTAVITALAAIGLLATTSAASAGKVAGYDGPLLASDSPNGFYGTIGSTFHLYGPRDFRAIYLKNTGATTMHVHIEIRPEQGGRFLLAHEILPRYEQCATLTSGEKCQQAVLFEEKGSPATATLEIFDDHEPAYKVRLTNH